MRQIKAFVILTLFFRAATAQEEQPLELLDLEPVRRYTVELIVFSYEENVSVGTEIFIPDEPPVDEDPLLDVDGLDGEVPVDEDLHVEDDQLALEGEEVETLVRELELELLAEEDFTLGKIARQFELLDVYETIMHVGWTQPTYPAEETPPIELRVLGDPPEGLEGSLTLYLSRYLHLVVDLALDAPAESIDPFADEGPAYSDDPVYNFGDSRRPYDDFYGRLPQRTRYRIQENRIVKNGELRYFDHPKFGVLAKITRVEEEEEELDNDGLSDPLLGSTR